MTGGESSWRARAHTARSLPNSPKANLLSPPQPEGTHMVTNTTNINRQCYNAKSYEDISGLGCDVLAKKLDLDLSSGTQEKIVSSPASSNSSAPPPIGHLDCTIGSKDSSDSSLYNGHHRIRHPYHRHIHDDLDVSLEHETKGLQNGRRTEKEAISSPRSDHDCYQSEKVQKLSKNNFSKSTPDLQRLNYDSTASSSKGAQLRVYGDIDVACNSGQYGNARQMIEHSSRSHRSAVVWDKEGRGLQDLTSPIQSLRLRPIRQKTRNAVVGEPFLGNLINWNSV